MTSVLSAGGEETQHIQLFFIYSPYLQGFPGEPGEHGDSGRALCQCSPGPNGDQGYEGLPGPSGVYACLFTFCLDI